MSNWDSGGPLLKSRFPPPPHPSPTDNLLISSSISETRLTREQMALVLIKSEQFTKCEFVSNRVHQCVSLVSLSITLKRHYKHTRVYPLCHATMIHLKRAIFYKLLYRHCMPRWSVATHLFTHDYYMDLQFIQFRTGSSMVTFHLIFSFTFEVVHFKVKYRIKKIRLPTF